MWTLHCIYVLWKNENESDDDDVKKKDQTDLQTETDEWMDRSRSAAAVLTERKM